MKKGVSLYFQIKCLNSKPERSVYLVPLQVRWSFEIYKKNYNVKILQEKTLNNTCARISYNVSYNVHIHDIFENCF